MQKQGKTKQKVHKNNIEFVLCWPTAPGYEICPGITTGIDMLSETPLQKTVFHFASE